MKKGICPKCNGTTIYTDKNLPKRGERCQVTISSMKWLFVDVYICIDCKYFEEYISENLSLNGEKQLNKMKETWAKV